MDHAGENRSCEYSPAMNDTSAANSFAERLTQAVRRCGNPVLVGLDPRWDSLPASFRNGRDPADLCGVADAYRSFCLEIIDVVAPLVPCVKPQAAFFEDVGPEGMRALADVVAHARQRGLLVILDGKRNDIGSTASAYASAYLGESSPWGADALTVSPYLGDDSLSPFVQVARERAAGVFVLVKTSNPGGGLFQDLRAGELRVFEHVAAYVERLAFETAAPCGYGAVGAVAGATYPEQLCELRSAMPHTWFLVPGVGAQGASARDVAGAFDAAGTGAIVNSSRAIIFAHSRKEYKTRFGDSLWQQAVEAATRQLIEELRSETPAGKLAT